MFSEVKFHEELHAFQIPTCDKELFTISFSSSVIPKLSQLFRFLPKVRNSPSLIENSRGFKEGVRI